MSELKRILSKVPISQGLLILFILSIISCNPQNEDTAALDVVPQFEMLDKSVTGLNFSNSLEPSLDLNIFNYLYYYNGGGVAAADFNNDGLVDLYFTANEKPNKLFINKGDFRFEDVTELAGVKGFEGWTTGVAAVDINADGLMDLYVNQVGKYRTLESHNQLYICERIDKNGVPHYTESSKDWGLDLVSFGTQAAFLDYDMDGDLDMYQMNHSVHQNGTFGRRFTFEDKPHPLSGDKLMRNDGDHFTDVTDGSGILSTVIGYGLGVAVSDINLDGWPDLYIGNDFHENDYLYLNQQNGTFKEVLTEQIRHTSRYTMGVDIADINNDAQNEILSLDMLPFDPTTLKRSQGEEGYAIFQFKLGYGYNHQYARNNLQLNNKNGTFSEIGMYSGVFATDWSWAPLFCDLNNDGYKDLFISNGIPRRMNDIDYINFLSNDEIRYRIQTDNMEDSDLALMQKLPVMKLMNKIFINNKDLTFTDISNAVKGANTSFSNGAVYADFDSDGDLDIVVNNIEDFSYVYKNLTSENSPQQKSVLVHLKGSSSNPNAVGSKIVLYTGQEVRIFENFTTRGFQSSIPASIFIGLGDGNSVIDSAFIIWPDRSFEEIELAQGLSAIKLEWKSGLPLFDYSRLNLSDPDPGGYIIDISNTAGIDVSHDENPFVEFNREQLIPYMVSAEGPALAVGDVNNDGLEDVFIGSAKVRQSTMLYQTDNGFTRSDQPSIGLDSTYEDVDAELIDLNNDGRLDLVVASGGNEYWGDSEYLLPRAYLNDGTGEMHPIDGAFTDIFVTQGCIAPQDINNDGFIDLFIGGLAVPWNFGELPRSYLLINDGTGHFTDVTEEYSEDLQYAGFVKNATWVDLDNDNDHDLLLSLEWGPMTIYENKGGAFEKLEIEGTSGWWKFTLPGDFDGDGDIDFFAGNVGQNSKLKPSETCPITMYVNDYDDNGHIEQILTYYPDGKTCTILPTHMEVTKQLPDIKKEYLFAKEFATADIEEMFGAEKVKESLKYSVTLFDNSYFENKGNMQFERSALPPRLQFAPLNTAISYDFNNDGLQDVLFAGNFYENNIELGRYDADYGTIMLNSKDGFKADSIVLLKLDGQFRRSSTLRLGEKTSFILTRNNDKPAVLMPAREQEVPDESNI